MRNRLLSAIDYREFRPLFVLGAARTGTYMAVDYLSSVPGIAMTDEVLNPGREIGLELGVGDERVRQHIRRSLGALRGPVRGAKIMLSSPGDRITPAQLLRLYGTASFVIVYRENLLDQYISLLEARASGQWELRSEKYRSPPPRVGVDLDRLMQYAEDVRHRYDFVLGDVGGARTVSLVSYEQMCERPTEMISGIARSLGLPPVDAVTTATHKQGMAPRSERVVNWAEIRHLDGDPALVLDLGGRAG